MGSLSIKACQLGNWEACNTYAVMSFEGLFGIKKDIPFGMQLAEKACVEGNDLKACINLMKIYEEGLLGVKAADPLSQIKLEQLRLHFDQISGQNYDHI